MNGRVMLTPTQQQIRDAAIDAAISYGFKQLEEPNGLRAPPGKFEGEAYYVLHFWQAVLDGAADEPQYDGDDVAADILEVSDDERAAFELNASTAFVALWCSPQGFVILQELAADEYHRLREGRAP